ncbi:hypothetical protein BE20_32730 [Sorangium cellulosum]|uniref:Uncharacterized protein n=1 Tax=Sorangium cellulosum TaxID=56 RepID=A0A150SEW2_SORCE|nr:hypothetical protein BE18_05460 [Sorangium cellulosum]KYF99101.1 hypothetical protein BE20_32730 [Sorangium cellulosum]
MFCYGEEGSAADDVHHHIEYEQDDAPYFVKPRLVHTTDAEADASPHIIPRISRVTGCSRRTSP